MMPGFLDGYNILYEVLLKLKKEVPYMLYENQEISFLYDCYPNAIWNGGTIALDNKKFYLKEDIEKHIDFFNNYLNLPLAFTFTNPNITKELCYDSYCNLIAELGENKNNYIIVSNPILENYLRKKYPKYKFCHSIINSNDLAPITENYSFSLLKRKNNNNFNLLKNIPEEERSKIEILCTDKCAPECNRINEHYKIFGSIQKKYGITNEENIDCSFIQRKTNNPYYITKQQIDELYVPLGYTHFKISGRKDITLVLYLIMQYFIKPEYYLEVYNTFVINLYKNCY